MTLRAEAPGPCARRETKATTKEVAAAGGGGGSLLANRSSALGTGEPRNPGLGVRGDPSQSGHPRINSCAASGVTGAVPAREEGKQDFEGCATGGTRGRRLGLTSGRTMPPLFPRLGWPGRAEGEQCAPHPPPVRGQPGAFRGPRSLLCPPGEARARPSSSSAQDAAGPLRTVRRGRGMERIPRLIHNIRRGGGARARGAGGETRGSAPAGAPPHARAASQSHPAAGHVTRAPPS